MALIVVYHSHSVCSNLGARWCVAAYTLHKTSGSLFPPEMVSFDSAVLITDFLTANSQASISGPQVTAPVGAQIEMHCTNAHLKFP